MRTTSFPSSIHRALPLLIAALTLKAAAQSKPPVAPIKPVTDTYYGQRVVDNYRWLEDQKSPDSVAWMKGQADFARASLDSLAGRNAFQAEMTKYMDAADVTISDIQLAGDFVFYRKRNKDENQSSLYVRKAAGGPERLLLNVPKLSTPGHHISLDQYTPSEDGSLVVVGLSAGGSEMQTAHIYETATDRELPETLERYEGGGFSPGGKILYYAQLEDLGPHGNPIDKYKRPKEYAHVIGTPITADSVILGQGVSADVPVPDYNFPFAFPVPNSKHALAVIAPGVETFREFYVGEPSALATHTGWTHVGGVKDKITDAALEGDDLYLAPSDHVVWSGLLRRVGSVRYRHVGEPTPYPYPGTPPDVDTEDRAPARTPTARCARFC